MKLHNVTRTDTDQFKQISLDCQQFLEESNAQPMTKWCSSAYPDVHRVKVRRRKHTNEFDDAFNRAFDAEYPSVRRRSIIVNDEKIKDDSELFYIFPSDGYKFLYAPRIDNSKEQYGKTYEDMKSAMADTSMSEGMFREVLSYSYEQENLEKAIVAGLEIIVYNIPFFYVVRANVPYKKILEYI